MHPFCTRQNRGLERLSVLPSRINIRTLDDSSPVSGLNAFLGYRCRACPNTLRPRRRRTRISSKGWTWTSPAAGCWAFPEFPFPSAPWPSAPPPRGRCWPAAGAVPGAARARSRRAEPAEGWARSCRGSAGHRRRGRADGAGGGRPFGVRSTFLCAYVAGGRAERTTSSPLRRLVSSLGSADTLGYSSKPQLRLVSVGEGGGLTSRHLLLPPSGDKDTLYFLPSLKGYKKDLSPILQLEN